MTDPEEAARSAYKVQMLSNKQAHVVWAMMNCDQSDTEYLAKCQNEVSELSDQIYEEMQKRPNGFQQNVAYSSSNLATQMMQGVGESANKVWLYGAGALVLAATSGLAAPLAIAGAGMTTALAGAAGAAISATFADGVFSNSFVREAAETYQNLRAKNLDHTSARLWAIGAGAIKAGIEVNVASRVMKAYGLGSVLKDQFKVTTLTKLMGNKVNHDAINLFAKNGGVEKLLAEKGFRDFVIDRMKDFGVDVAANTAEEIQQEFVDVAFECMAGAIAQKILSCHRRTHLTGWSKRQRARLRSFPGRSL